jgi:type I restriction enzyme S subunit
MGLKTFTIDFSELTIDPKLGLKDYSCLYKNGVRLKSLLINQNVQTGIKSGRTPSRFNEDYWNGKNEFLTMSDVDTLTFSINPECVDKITDYAVEEEKTLYQAKQNSLIVSNAMTVGLSFLLDRPVFINQNVFDVNLDETKINKKFVLWYLNLIVRPLFQTTYTSKYLSKDELGRIKIPLIPKPKQDQIVAQIEPIEKKIINSKSQIKEPQEVINKVFAREFGFDLEKFEKIKKEKFFEVDFSNVNTSLIRSTVIQNKSSSSFLKSFLSKNSLFLKDIILKPIKRGKQPEYTEDGIKVIKTLNIQKGKITFEEVQFVSEKFLKDNEKKAGIYQYDLLLTSTGMGRGKFALYEEEEICFADSHVSIIRFNQEKINPNFLNYYCQSFFGIEQLKYIEMQIKGTPEIYETQLNYFQIPDISLKAQQKIVDEIKAELDKQEEIKSKIENERNKIDEIIEKAIE